MKQSFCKTAVFVPVFVLCLASAVIGGETAAFVTIWGSEGDAEGQFSLPEHLIVGRDGTVYVSDILNHRIQKFDWRGTFLMSWGSLGDGDGQFNVPCELDMDSEGNLYVADRGNHRIQKFDSNGNFLLKWGKNSGDPGDFVFPLGLSVHGTRLFVSDLNDRVQIFDLDGQFLSGWGDHGNGPGEFDLPLGLDADQFGHVYVTDNQNGRVQKFDNNGVYLTEWITNPNGGPSAPSGIAVTPAGDEVYVTDSFNGFVMQFDAVGNVVAILGEAGQEPGQFFEVKGVALGPNENLYVADTGNHRVQLFGEAPFRMAADDPILPVGEPAAYRVFSGIPGETGFAFLTELNGAPFFVLIASAEFDANGHWALELEPGANVFSITTRAFLRDGLQIRGTNPETVLFQ